MTTEQKRERDLIIMVLSIYEQGKAVEMYHGKISNTQLEDSYPEETNPIITNLEEGKYIDGHGSTDIFIKYSLTAKGKSYLKELKQQVFDETTEKENRESDRILFNDVQQSVKEASDAQKNALCITIGVSLVTLIFVIAQYYKTPDRLYLLPTPKQPSLDTTLIQEGPHLKSAETWCESDTSCH